MKNKLNVIILAAGYGNRLGTKLNNVPKCLLKVKNKTLIEHIIIHLINFKISEVTIATGFKKNLVKAELKKYQNKINIQFINNKYFRSSGHGYTIYNYLKNEKKINDLLIIHGDLFFYPDILKKAIRKSDHSLLMTDKSFKVNTNDEMIVTSKNSYVRTIEKYNKGITDIKGEIVGINYWNKKFVNKYFIFCSKLFRLEGIQFNWEQILNRMLSQSKTLRIKYIDIGINKWININYSQDYIYAKKISKNINSKIK